jgi:hypothetical protein
VQFNDPTRDWTTDGTDKVHTLTASADFFALGPATLNTLAQPSFLMLGYVFRPYTAQTVMGRVTYLW